MNGMQRTLIRLMSISGAARLVRALFALRARFVLEFHGVARRIPPDIPRRLWSGLTVEELRAVLIWLSERFAFLSPEEFFYTRKAGVLLTFDDGLANNHTNALPVLEELQAPAVFFVATQHVIDPRDWLPATHAAALAHWGTEAHIPANAAAELYDGMSEAQLRACAASPYVTIGSHTVSHARLTQCSDARLKAELVTSRGLLTDITGQPVDLFAYPYGSYDRRVMEATRAAGYRAAFAEDSRRIGMLLYEIPRIGIYSSDHAYLDVKLSGLHRRPATLQSRQYLPSRRKRR